MPTPVELSLCTGTVPLPPEVPRTVQPSLPEPEPEPEHQMPEPQPGRLAGQRDLSRGAGDGVRGGASGSGSGGVASFQRWLLPELRSAGVSAEAEALYVPCVLALLQLAEPGSSSSEVSTAAPAPGGGRALGRKCEGGEAGAGTAAEALRRAKVQALSTLFRELPWGTDTTAEHERASRSCELAGRCWDRWLGLGLWNGADATTAAAGVPGSDGGGGGGGGGDEEARVDPADGQLYTKAQFVQYYGGLGQWNQAAVAAASHDDELVQIGRHADSVDDDFLLYAGVGGGKKKQKRKKKRDKTPQGAGSSSSKTLHLSELAHWFAGTGGSQLDWATGMSMPSGWDDVFGGGGGGESFLCVDWVAVPEALRARRVNRRRRRCATPTLLHWPSWQQPQQRQRH
jgi:hypothetical protein